MKKAIWLNVRNKTSLTKVVLLSYTLFLLLFVQRVVAQTAPNGTVEGTDLSISLRLWLDANDISTLFQNSAGTTPVTAHGQPVQRWNDKSSYGSDLTRPGGTNPLYDTSSPYFNGFPSIDFGGGTNGSRLINNITGGWNTEEYTLFIVLLGDSTNPTLNESFFSLGTNTSNDFQIDYKDTNGVFRYKEAGGFDLEYGPYQQNTLKLYGIRANNDPDNNPATTDIQLEAMSEGAIVNTVTSRPNNNSALTTFNQYRLNRNRADSRSFNSHIAEIGYQPL